MFVGCFQQFLLFVDDVLLFLMARRVRDVLFFPFCWCDGSLLLGDVSPCSAEFRICWMICRFVLFADVCVLCDSLFLCGDVPLLFEEFRLFRMMFRRVWIIVCRCLELSPVLDDFSFWFLNVVLFVDCPLCFMMCCVLVDDFPPFWITFRIC